MDATRSHLGKAHRAELINTNRVAVVGVEDVEQHDEHALREEDLLLVQQLLELVLIYSSTVITINLVEQRLQTNRSFQALIFHLCHEFLNNFVLQLVSLIVFCAEQVALV